MLLAPRGSSLASTQLQRRRPTASHSKKESGWNCLEIATNDRICLEKSGHGRKCIWMTGYFFAWLKRVGNSWKQKCCLLLRLQSTRTLQFYWTFGALCLPLCSLPTSPYAEKVWMLRDSTVSVLRSTVRLRYRKSISGHHFQTIGKIASNDFNYHT